MSRLFVASSALAILALLPASAHAELRKVDIAVLGMD